MGNGPNLPGRRPRRSASPVGVVQHGVDEDAPEGGEVDVELAVRDHVGRQQDKHDHQGVGVGDQEPAGETGR